MPDIVATPQDTAETTTELHTDLDQALASTRLEGHVPTSGFLADCEDYIAGRITREEAMARSTARAFVTEWVDNAT